MRRRRRGGRRIAEQQANYSADATLPPFASTPDEIQRAVERNSIQRGVFIISQLQAQNFHNLIQRVEALAETYDATLWRQQAALWRIDPHALALLDGAQPPSPYPHYFCHPQLLIGQPALIKYYRNVAMVSQKVMGDMGLGTVAYEAGLAPSSDAAEALTHLFNEIISALIIQSKVTPTRHLEMAYANLGDSLGGAWRNEVGRLAYVEVLTPVIRRLHEWSCLEYVQYSLKGPVVREIEEDAEEPVVRGARHRLMAADVSDLPTQLDQLKKQRIVYTEIGLRNGNKLLINRQITWPGPGAGETFKIGPDLFSSPDGNAILWGGELKGGADPAGSDEHWKTATRAFDRILLACERTGRPQPPLSFIATILVERVAVEAAQWLAEGKLTSVYNLTQIAEDAAKQNAFLTDLALFLECSPDERQPGG